MITRGKQARLDLAQRHARKIERKHGLERGGVTILSRRNDSGRFSARGRNFFFDVPEKRRIVIPEPPPSPPKKPKSKEIGNLKDFLEEMMKVEDGTEFEEEYYEGGTDYGEE